MVGSLSEGTILVAAQTSFLCETKLFPYLKQEMQVYGWIVMHENHRATTTIHSSLHIL